MSPEQRDTIRARLLVIAADAMGHPLSYGHLIRRALTEVIEPAMDEERRAGAEKALREAAEEWFYDGDHDRPRPGYKQLLDRADQIAQGQP
jgi:hypothetical protein